MYRKASSTSVLCGVPSGVYAGGKRVIDGALLEAATRERLDRSLSARGTPAPIAYERPATHASSRPRWGIIGATMGLSALFAIGFGNLDSDWAMPPWWTLALHLALGFLFAWSLLSLLRRRVLFGGGARGALRPGRYLFPLDAFEISLPDAMGRQLVTVYPLGDARHADIEIAGRRVELLVRFEGGETLRFPLRGDHKGTVALRRLERAQRLLEDLTYQNRLEDAFANDLFFDLRVDDAWKRFAPSAGPTPVRAPNVVSLALGRFAPVLVAVLTIGLGAGTFFLRREAGDTALYNHAVAYGSVEAMDRYLARGGRKRLAAEDLRTRLLESERRQRERAPSEPPKPYAFDAAEEAAVDQRCVDALEARASSAHPKAVPALVRSVRQRVRTLYFGVKGEPRGVEPNPRFDVAAEMASDQRTMELAFGVVLSEICPSSVLSIETPIWGERRSPRVVIDATARWVGPSWHLVDPDAKPFDVSPLRVDFHVELVEGQEVLESFDLSVPPPPEPLLGTRPKSLFTLAGPSGTPPLPPGVHDERVYHAMVARAYDRLYDELWSLFFEGDPRVPLVPAPVFPP